LRLRGRSGRPRQRSGGFALIVVLWFLVLLAAVGTYLMANGRSETALAHNMLAAAHAETLADGAIAEAAASQLLSDPTKRWRLDGTPYHVSLQGGDATIRLVNEAQKINPNLASDALLSGLFQALGLDRDHSDRLGAAIADWVQSGDTPRPLGAKKAQYESAGRTYGPPGQPIENLDELQLVLGMTPQLLATALPYLTIYTQNPAPEDPRAMSPVVLRATQIAAFRGAAGGQPADATAGGQNGESEIVMTVEATVHGNDGGVFVRRAVIAVNTDAGNTQENPKGYRVMDWRRGILPN
jgi:general secretion pathway protein K